jgi:hypothetical protein
MPSEHCGLITLGDLIGRRLTEKAFEVAFGGVELGWVSGHLLLITYPQGLEGLLDFRNQAIDCTFGASTLLSDAVGVHEMICQQLRTRFPSPPTRPTSVGMQKQALRGLVNQTARVFLRARHS